MWLASAVEHWPVERLIPFARNPRTHTDEQVAQIAASIAEFGWTNPVLVGADGVIIAGHARLQAARKLGLSEVPVIVLDHLSEAQRRALVIADNKLALNAGWDEELLRGLLSELREDEFNLEVLGFSDEELNALLTEAPDLAEGLTDEDAVPEPLEEPVSRRGDLWILGEHRLLCGDSANREDVDRLMAGEVADLVNTDPPYNVRVEPRSNNAISAALSSFGGLQRSGAPARSCAPRIARWLTTFSRTPITTYCSGSGSPIWPRCSSRAGPSTSGAVTPPAPTTCRRSRSPASISLRPSSGLRTNPYSREKTSWGRMNGHFMAGVKVQRTGSTRRPGMPPTCGR